MEVKQKSSPSHPPRSNSFTGTPVFTQAAPPAIKPTSRARAYRIPNTADAGGDTGKNAASGAGTDSFLWATREIAALDFLMNVPLSAEREIVRAGLAGERWQMHESESYQILTKQNQSDVELGVVHESAETNYGVPPAAASIPHRWSNFSTSRNPSIEDDSTITLSTVHSMSEKAGSSSTGVADIATAATAPTGGRWWEKMLLKDKRFFSAANQQQARMEQLELEERELERPDDYHPVSEEAAAVATPTHTMKAPVGPVGIPGRRLDGREAINIDLPKEFRTRPLPIRSVARQAAVREWEMKVAWHGVADRSAPPTQHQSHHNDKTKALLDGRIFFSAKKSYPMALFSCIKYEPQKEEAARRRKKLEELGGGGTQFVLPERDWRGISYRALLPQKREKKRTDFNRFTGNSPPLEKKPKKSSSNETSEEEDSNEEDEFSLSSEESAGGYTPGFLDDPGMKQGRHRNVMIGDKISGPIISSTIQFVKPSVLKAELNKQFRERFDQWEPPKSQRKFIGATVIDGVYTLIDPTETTQENGEQNENRRPRAGSLTDRETIRMPPSLTLSKIRSLKQQALVLCVSSQIELSTLALACVYFERLCLDCRVDKSNRRLSFAACLFLAAKINESNTIIAFDHEGAETKSWVKPSKKSGKIFESLVLFFTHDWGLSLKQLYAAEWIVFTALGFSLKSTPSQVAFHFKRLLKVLEWDSRSYLGDEMYVQWQDSLQEEARRNERRKMLKEIRIKTNERKLLNLQRKLHAEGTHHRRTSTSSDSQGFRRHSINTVHSTTTDTPKQDGPIDTQLKAESPAARGILSRLARSKIATQHSHGEDLDRLPKHEKKLTWSRHSHSTPNLKALAKEAKASDLGDVAKIPEGEFSPHSKDDADMDYNIIE